MFVNVFCSVIYLMTVSTLWSHEIRVVQMNVDVGRIDESDSGGY